jgi:hypothetical protein
MESSKRDSKRQSAKKSKEHSIYSQKAVRAKEALIDKQKFASSPSQPKKK